MTHQETMNQIDRAIAMCELAIKALNAQDKSIDAYIKYVEAKTA